ncbi:testis-expressed protein 10 homolog isoform X2 [Orussus abietinus]|uniref:testis-expressed protein 10 homolog isoform X2 n=1 Tax=Orussus abietinus TaxID=222816 RepID=UPI0006264F0E|nr:testis-expressed protein 10 homolog isoform X2 [Orussus abietinus]
MGKGNKHQKSLKSEKAKVKLKAKKVKHLPKGLNVTDTSFKVKKIIIREQLKQQEDGGILSRRKLNVKDLLSRLRHHNSTVRRDAIGELKEIILQYSTEILSSQLNALLHGVCSLALDKERDVRRDAIKVLISVLSPISNEQLLPFADIPISYLKCAMTHIDPNIKEDSLILLDVLVQNCGGLVAKNSRNILPNFLDMISKLRTDAQAGRQLVTSVNSKSTSIEWRIKVFNRLTNILESLVNEKKVQNFNHCNNIVQTIKVDESAVSIPMYQPNNLGQCIIDFDYILNISDEGVESKDFESEELVKCISASIPLLFGTWIEVCPKNRSTHSDLVISSEASSLLKSLLNVLQLTIDYIDELESKIGVANISKWFAQHFQNSFVENIFLKFPFRETKNAKKAKRRQEDFCTENFDEESSEQNLAICQLYIWFASVRSGDELVSILNKDYCTRVLEYLNGKIGNWTSFDYPVLPQLVKLLRTLFLRASKIWYTRNISLGETLRIVTDVYSRQPRKELQSQLFTVLSEITMDHSLINLHREEAFKRFVTSLPELLLKSSVYDSTIQTLNRVVLRHRAWIQEVLTEKHEAILGNARKIQIIGSENEELSRLTICNLFYFLEEQIYY